MTDERRKCYNCQYYVPYYCKGTLRFDKQDCGHCYKHGNVDKSFTCERWTFNNEFGKRVVRRMRREVLLKRIDEALQEIKQISQILKEENEEV